MPVDHARASTGEQLEQTIELTRIMLLSPIFLALGAVATSVLNAGGRFAASAVAPIVYNLAIIGGALFLAPIVRASTGLAVGVVAGSLGHLLVQLRPLRRLGFRYEPRIDPDGPGGAPGAAADGAAGVRARVPARSRSSSSPRWRRRCRRRRRRPTSTIAFTLLQIPIGVIGVPLGIVRPAVPVARRGASVARPSSRAC